MLPWHKSNETCNKDILREIDTRRKSPKFLQKSIFEATGLLKKDKNAPPWDWEADFILFYLFVFLCAKLPFIPEVFGQTDLSKRCRPS